MAKFILYHNRIFKQISSLVLITCISITFSTCKKNNQAGPLPEVLFVKTKAGLKLRELPNQDSKVIKLIPFNKDVCVIEKSSDEVTIDNKKGKWVKLIYNSEEGWAFDAFLGEGAYEGNIFLKTYSSAIINGFKMDYNSDFLSRVYDKELSATGKSYQPLKIDISLFKIRPSTSPGEKVMIITTDNKVLNDLAESFYIMKTDYGVEMFFTLEKNRDAEGVCFKEKYITDNNITLAFPAEQQFETGTRTGYISESIKYLIDNNLKNSLQVHPYYDDSIDLAKLDQYIINNFTIEVKNYSVPGDTYTFIFFKHVKPDLQFLDATVIIKNSGIIFAQNSRRRVFFLINNKPYILISIWKPYTDAYGEPLAEITGKGLDYKFLN